MSLLTWIESLLKDKDAGAAFLSSPVATMEAAGFDASCGMDAKDASLALFDNKHIVADHDAPSAVAIAVSDGDGSGAEYIKQIVKHYHYKDSSETEISNVSNSWDNDSFSFDIDDRDTTVDSSVDASQNMGDVTMGDGGVFAPLNAPIVTTETNTASGDNSAAAGDDMEAVQTGDGNTNASHGGSIENNTAGDDVAHRGGDASDTEVDVELENVGNDNSDNSTEVEIDDIQFAGDDAQMESGDGSVQDDGLQLNDNEVEVELETEVLPVDLA